MARINLFPYLRQSQGVLYLQEKAREENIDLRVRVKTPPKRGILVNWGYRSKREGFDQDRVVVPILNPLRDLHLMTDKLRFFRHVGQDCELVPNWTDSEDVAREWDNRLLARYVTGGSGGEGISIWEPGQGDAPFPGGAPLYTRYIKKTHEFRCHAFKDRATGAHEIRLTQRKGARKNPDTGKADVKNWQIRNLENGFVFVKNDGLPVPQVVTDVALKLMGEYFPNLHFCALDVIYHEPTNKAYVLEGNTAPGLEGTTVDVYLNYFKEWII